MTRRIGLAACAALVFGLTVGLVAQGAQTPDKQTPASAADKKITVSGCVQRAQQPPAAATGTPGAAASAAATKFVLTNAAIAPAAATGTTGGATTPPAATAVASEYRLDAEDAKLTPHVGHKVEISGTVRPPAASATQPPAASAANAPMLKVDTVKMVASSCP